MRTNDENTEPRATNRRHIQATNTQKSYDTPMDELEKSSSSPRNVRNACFERGPLSRTAPIRNFGGGMSVPIRYEVPQVRRGDATHQLHGRRRACRTGRERATTTRGGVSITRTAEPHIADRMKQVSVSSVFVALLRT